jgi:hypothetical protein
MFKELLSRRTVMVLGAGASSPYGFPLGIELRNQLINSIKGGELRTTPEGLSFPRDLVADFCLALSGTSHPTVDTFLEHKPQYRELGAYMIAKQIMTHEKNSSNRLFPKRDWYGLLYDLLALENPDVPVQNLSIVTLNYDRTLEHFLTRTVDWDCHESRITTARARLASIKIIHAHGSLGEYSRVTYPLDSDSPQAVSKAAENIKIISDNLDDSEAFKAAQALLGVAERILFLGFGYHPQTLRRLLKYPGAKGSMIFGSRAGVAYELDKNLFGGRDAFFGDRSHKCLEFLKSLETEPFRTPLRGGPPI